MILSGADDVVQLQELECYGSLLKRAQDEIELKFLVVGRTGLPVGAPAGMTRDGEIEKEGVLPSGAEFSFHGMGCRVTLLDETEVDFDWDRKGRQIFDAWRFSRFLGSRGWSGCETSVTMQILERASASGIINRTDGKFYYFD